MIKVAIAGCGKIAQVRHLPEYEANIDAEIVGVYDSCISRAKELSIKYNTKLYNTYEALIQDSNVDAVSICTANRFHADMTVQALNAGKHVLCEKPMAMSIEDCQKMIEAAEKNHKYLMIGHNQRFARAHKEAKKMIEEGKLGKILSFKTNFSHKGPETWSITPGKNVWFFDKKTAVLGVMADLGIHKTDLIQYLVGSRITAVSSKMATLDKKLENGKSIDVEDNAICIYEMENGIIGVMSVSWTNYGAEDNSTVIYGTEGVMHIYCDPKYSIIIERKDGVEERYVIDQIQTNDNQVKSGVIDSWIYSLTHDMEPEVSGIDALQSMKAIYAAAKSSESGERIEVY